MGASAWANKTRKTMFYNMEIWQADGKCHIMIIKAPNWPTLERRGYNKKYLERRYKSYLEAINAARKHADTGEEYPGGEAITFVIER